MKGKNMRIKSKKKIRRKKNDPQKKSEKREKQNGMFIFIFSQNSPRPQERLNWVSST
jgi:hypothetical protein